MSRTSARSTPIQHGYCFRCSTDSSALHVCQSVAPIQADSVLTQTFRCFVRKLLIAACECCASFDLRVRSVGLTLTPKFGLAFLWTTGSRQSSSFGCESTV